MGGFAAFVSAGLSEKRHRAGDASISYMGNYFFARYCEAPPMTLARIAARSTRLPRRYTDETRRVFVMLSIGFASSTTKSALLPTHSAHVGHPQEFSRRSR